MRETSRKFKARWKKSLAQKLLLTAVYLLYKFDGRAKIKKMVNFFCQQEVGQVNRKHFKINVSILFFNGRYLECKFVKNNRKIYDSRKKYFAHFFSIYIYIYIYI